MNIEDKKQQFLEHLMARIILSGGRVVPPEELRDMKLGSLMDLIYPNKIELHCSTVKQIEFDINSDEYDPY